MGAGHRESDFSSHHAKIFNEILARLQEVLLFPGENLKKSSLRGALKVIDDSSACNT
jgi:hypothetical protein